MDGDPRDRITCHRHATELGTWTVATCQPRPCLTGLVAAIWYGEGQVSYARDRILPGGRSFLLINLGPLQYLVEPGPPEMRVPFRDLWFSGAQQRPLDTEAPHGNALVGVAFHVAGAYALLGVEQQDLADRVVPLADLLGDSVLALRQRLLDTPSIEGRLSVVEDWLLARLAPDRGVHPAVQWALQRIAATQGQVSVATLARESGYTRKHLAGLFARQTGLAPKVLARVQRFRAALGFLGRSGAVPWAELAARCGYYDQSHLVRDFRAFSGCSPGDFVRHARPDADSIVVR
jgi:AraC-like DNA-binding protein